jgi:hypothetical protein
MRICVCGVAYFFGVVLAFVAAITRSIGPEPPDTPLGQTLAVVYRPYYDFFCGPFQAVGFLFALALSGVPFAVLAWLGLRIMKIGDDN